MKERMNNTEAARKLREYSDRLGRDGASCPIQDALDYAVALLERSSKHVIDICADGLVIEHPLSCRDDGKSLLDCPFTTVAQKSFDEVQPADGRYEVFLDEYSNLVFTEDRP